MQCTFPARLAMAGILSIAASMPFAEAATVDSIEFYNTQLNHYFRTESATEAAGIDAGNAGPGWVRTGYTYKVWRTAADAPAGANPVCRFYSSGFNSHFFTASPGECNLLKTNEIRDRAALAPGQPYTGWQYEAIVSYALMPTGGKCPSGTMPIYRNYAGFTVNHRFSNVLPVFQDMNDKGWISEGVQLCEPGTSLADQADAYRLLKQATFGANDASLADVQTRGITGWVDYQLNSAPASSFPNLPYVAYTQPDTCTGTCARDNYSLFPVQMAMLQNALSGQDQLRQRVAFALSQILVTSGVEIFHAYGMTRYQQIFMDNAFGNYKDLLTAVTLSPVMGRYLDMANSNKPNPALGISANENYAREIMQLFSIGLYQLNADGSQKLDANGQPIPSYTQTTVENLARVFTGWTYASLGGGAATKNNGVYYEFPMVAVESNHDTGTKTLVDGYVVPAGQTTAKDLADAIDHLFNHPNVGPFISKQLIQKLVGGNPDPAYVARITAVFNDNGAGVRGDLKAVVRAILLDPAARGEIKTDAGYGHLMEPVLLATTLMRGLGGTSDGVYQRGQLSGMGQNLYYSPTVFNYYSPENQISNGKLGPEFGIQNSTTAFARSNFIYNMIYTNSFAADTTVTGSTGTTINWTPWQTLAANPAALVDKLSWTFAAGSLSASAQTTIVNAVNAVTPATDTLSKARLAAYLVLTSSQAQIIK
jgi:uncharacterized protein (DUF1800 family)